jgi:hypothetical protein
MSVHIAETIIDPKGRVVLDHLPFQPGEVVEVVVLSHGRASGSSDSLRGSVLFYDEPFEPVAERDWELQD